MNVGKEIKNEDANKLAGCSLEGGGGENGNHAENNTDRTRTSTPEKYGHLTDSLAQLPPRAQAMAKASRTRPHPC